MRISRSSRPKMPTPPGPSTGPTCTAFASIEVPLKHGKVTNKNLRGCGELGKCVDADQLKLRCLPAS